jgi:hypothetical protein
MDCKPTYEELAQIVSSLENRLDQTEYGGPQKTNNVLSSKSTKLKGVDNEQEKETVQFRIQS